MLKDDTSNAPSTCVVLSRDRMMWNTHAFKIYAMLISPFKFAAFIDADIKICVSIKRMIWLAMFSFEGDVAAVYNFRGGHKYNSGVMFWWKNSLTNKLFQDWFNMYLSQERNMIQGSALHGTTFGDQNALMRALKYGRASALRMRPLPIIWNCKNNMGIPTHHTCCSYTMCFLDHNCIE